MDLRKAPKEEDKISVIAENAARLIIAQLKGRMLETAQLEWIIEQALRQGYDMGLKAEMLVHDFGDLNQMGKSKTPMTNTAVPDGVDACDYYRGNFEEASVNRASNYMAICNQELRFTECDSCRSEPGTPPLCQGCLNNRTVISKLIRMLT